MSDRAACLSQDFVRATVTKANRKNTKANSKSTENADIPMMAIQLIRVAQEQTAPQYSVSRA